MKKIASSIFLAVLFLQVACTASRNVTPSAIGIVPLQNFSVANYPASQDTSFKVYRNHIEFASAINASSAAAKKPDFYGQMAVAVITKASASMRFEKATQGANTVNIYLQSCPSTTQPPCQSGRLFLAAIPKVGNAKRVMFYIDGENRGTVNL